MESNSNICVSAEGNHYLLMHVSTSDSHYLLLPRSALDPHPDGSSTPAKEKNPSSSQLQAENLREVSDWLNVGHAPTLSTNHCGQEGSHACPHWLHPKPKGFKNTNS